MPDGVYACVVEGDVMFAGVEDEDTTSLTFPWDLWGALEGFGRGLGGGSLMLRLNPIPRDPKVLEDWA